MLCYMWMIFLITGVNKVQIADLIKELNNIFKLKRSQHCIDGKNKYNFDYVGVDIEYEKSKLHEN